MGVRVPGKISGNLSIILALKCVLGTIGICLWKPSVLQSKPRLYELQVYCFSLYSESSLSLLVTSPLHLAGTPL